MNFIDNLIFIAKPTTVILRKKFKAGLPIEYFAK